MDGMVWFLVNNNAARGCDIVLEISRLLFDNRIRTHRRWEDNKLKITHSTQENEMADR